MTRPAVLVRGARPDDLPALLLMWDELREMGSRLERVIPPSGAAGVLERLESVSRDPDSCAVVAVVDDEVAGMAVLTATAYAPLFEQRAVHAHYLHVRDGFRRRGVGSPVPRHRAVPTTSWRAGGRCGGYEPPWPASPTDLSRSRQVIRAVHTSRPWSSLICTW